jgi:hypothetical protein
MLLVVVLHNLQPPTLTQAISLTTKSSEHPAGARLGPVLGTGAQMATRLIINVPPASTVQQEPWLTTTRDDDRGTQSEIASKRTEPSQPASRIASPFKLSFTVRSGTTRVRHRIMAEFSLARSGIDAKPQSQADRPAGPSHLARDADRPGLSAEVYCALRLSSKYLFTAQFPIALSAISRA